MKMPTGRAMKKVEFVAYYSKISFGDLLLLPF
jgi:hypothetical protein